MANEQKSPIKSEIQDLSDRIGKTLKIDKEVVSGVAKATIPDTTYIDNLPEGITKEVVEQVQTYNTQMGSALALALGSAAIPAMKKNADISSVEVKMPVVGKDYIAVDFTKERQVPSRDENNQPNGTKSKFGNTTVEYGMYGMTSRGQLLAVKTLLTDQAMAAFGNKKAS